MDDRRADANSLKQERQSLLGLVRSLNTDMEDLRRQISGHEKTNQDKVQEATASSSHCCCPMSWCVVGYMKAASRHTQDNTISNLKKKNQDLEKLRFVLDCQLEDLRNQIEPQQEDARKTKEHIRQVCAPPPVRVLRQQRAALHTGFLFLLFHSCRRSCCRWTRPTLSCSSARPT